MNRVPSKHARLRLDTRAYEALRQEVLRRDGYRCQWCGTMLNLEVHHTHVRSHSGDDTEQNLITLCVACHALLHRNPSLQTIGRKRALARYSA